MKQHSYNKQIRWSFVSTASAGVQSMHYSFFKKADGSYGLAYSSNKKIQNLLSKAKQDALANSIPFENIELVEISLPAFFYKVEDGRFVKINVLGFSPFKEDFPIGRVWVHFDAPPEGMWYRFDISRTDNLNLLEKNQKIFASIKRASAFQSKEKTKWNKRK